jgi:sialate O-acetylesterase
MKPEISTMKIAITFAGAIAALTLGQVPAYAAVKLAPIFKDHMVLQRDQKLPVWGTANPGEKVTINLNQQNVIVQADKSGRFAVDLDNEPAGGPYKLVAKGSSQQIINDVLVGEVWFCAGQSNMVMLVSEAKDASTLASAPSSRLRVFNIEQKLAPEPIKTLNGQWLPANPETVGKFSAVAYSFGKDLEKELKVPVGIIVAAVGGSPIDAWLPASKKLTAAQLAALAAKAPAADRDKQSEPGKTKSVLDTNENLNTAFVDGKGSALLFNGMVNPLIPFAIKGILWYQGEADLGSAGIYRQRFAKLIEGYRDRWGQDVDDFPFIYVQMPNCELFTDKLGASVWVDLREAQNWSQGLRDVYAVTSLDLGEAQSVHPLRKKEVGQRAALIALAKAYGKKTECQGPKPDSFEIEGNKITIKFENVGKGMHFSGKNAFVLGGTNRQFKPAQAVINQNAITLWNDEIKRPVEVRYAWDNNPSGLLYNDSGLPASPFRHFFMPQ